MTTLLSDVPLREGRSMPGQAFRFGTYQDSLPSWHRDPFRIDAQRDERILRRLRTARTAPLPSEAATGLQDSSQRRQTRSVIGRRQTCA